MIFPEGFTPLVAISDELIADNKRMHASQNPFEGPESKATRNAWADWVDHSGFFEGVQNAWSFCDDEMHLPYTMLKNGKTVRLHTKLLNNCGIDPIGTFVDLSVGTLGSGSGHYSHKKFLDYDCRQDEEMLEEAIGIFMGYHVLFREKDANAYIRMCSKWEGSPLAPNHANIATQIVAAFDANPQITKSDAKRQFCPHMKSVEFLATWEIATRDRPSLSKSGPKPSK